MQLQEAEATEIKQLKTVPKGHEHHRLTNPPYMCHCTKGHLKSAISSFTYVVRVGFVNTCTSLEHFKSFRFINWVVARNKMKRKEQRPTKGFCRIDFSYIQCSLVVGLILGVISLNFYYPWTAREYQWHFLCLPFGPTEIHLSYL